MDSVDRYGLEASFSFTVSSSTRSTLQGVMADIHSLQKALGDLSKGSSAASGIGGLGGKQTKQASDGLKDIRSQFRALRAESRNIEFGDLKDGNAFKQGEAGLKSYIAELKRLESQITGTSASDRELKAQLISQQRIAGGKIDTAGNQRDALKSAEMVGKFQQLKQMGSGLSNLFDKPIANSIEYQTELAEINKLAGLTQENLAIQSSNILDLSNTTGVARQEISGVFANLASAGKSFSDLDAIKAEANGIIEVGKALGITMDAASGLDTSLSKNFGKSLDMYGGLISMNSRVGASINSLADNLENAQISGEDVARNFSAIANSYGDIVNLRPPDMAAFAAVTSDAGLGAEETVNFMSRLGNTMSKNADKFGQFTGMSGKAFKALYDTDQLGAYQKLLDSLYNFKGPASEKASILNSLGIGQAGDQSTINKLSANPDQLRNARRVSNEGFSQDLEKNSIARELSKEAESAAFQTKRANQAVENLMTSLGDSVNIALVPFKKAFADSLGQILNFTKAHPELTRVITIGTYALGIAAVAVGTLGTAFWGLRMATTESKLALDVLSRGMVPLTGFWQSATTALSAQGLAGAFTGLGTTISTFTGGALAAITSPISLLIAGLVGIYAALEYLTPGINVLGSVLGAIAAPIGFITGLVKGFATTLFSGLGERLGGLGEKLGGLSPVMGFLGDTVKIVSDTFSKFFGMGDTAGAGFANAILGMVDIVGGALGILWGAIDNTLIKPIQFAVSLWQTALGGLGAIATTAISAVQVALNPFAQVPVFVQGVIDQVRAIVSTITEVIAAPFRAATSTVNALWENTGGKIASVFGLLRDKSAETGQNLVSNLAENSPGPTWQIRQKWGLTTDAIATKLDGLMGFGEMAGQSLSSSLVLPKMGELQLPEMPKLGTIAAPVVGAANAIVPFPPSQPPINDFLGSLGNNPLEGVLAAIDNRFQSIVTQVKTATGGMISFAITSAISIAPLVLALTGVGLVIGAVTVNLLGLRDIVVGVGRAIGAILQAAKGVAIGVVQIIQGAIGFVRSIPAALTGDFTLMAQSIRGIWQGLSNVITSFANGVIGVFAGLGQSVRGVFIGLDQVLNLLFGGWYRSLVDSVNNGLLAIQQFGQSVSNAFSQVFSGQIFSGLVEQLNGGIRAIQQFVDQGVAGFYGLIQGVQNLLSAFGVTFQGTFLGGWFTDLNEVLNSARNAIASFITSITSALNKPIEAVGNTASKIKGMLGFGKKEVAAPTPDIAPEITPTFTAITPPKISPIVSPVEMPKIGRMDAIVPPAISGTKPEIPPIVQRIQRAVINPSPESLTVKGMQLPESNKISQLTLPDVAAPKVGAIGALPVPDISGIISAQQTLSVSTNLSLDSAGNALGQFGSLVGAIAPEFAAPIMAVSSFASTASGLLPTLTSMFPALGGLGTALMGLIPGLGGVTAAGGGLMAAFLPVIGIAAAVAGAFFLLKTAFDNNFLGLADAVNFVVSPFINGFEFIKNAVSGAIAFVGSKLTEGSNFFRSTVGTFLQPIFNLMGTIGRSIGTALAPVFDTLKLFSPILNAIGQAVMSTLAIPFKIAGGIVMTALNAIVSALTPVIQGVGAVVGAVINSIMVPVRVVLGAINLIQSGFKALSGAIGVLTSPIQMIQSALSGVASFFSQIPSMLGGIFNNLWNVIPAPIRWLVENAMGGMANIGGAFNQQAQQVPQFATGGIMPHEGLAYLHPNEFVVNPSATAGNLPALSQLNSTGSLPEVLAPVPIPVPSFGGQQPIAPPAPTQNVQPILNITIGDVIIQNATDGVQAANEFLESIAPQLERFIRNSLRSQTELAK